MTGFLARLADRINPIVVKEARQAVNSRLVSGTLMLFLGVQLSVMLLMLTGRQAAATSDTLDMRTGREVFTFVQGILLGTCMILIPALTGVRLAVERSDVNVDLLFISSLTPRAIVAGKLVTAAAIALLIFSACAPFMTFAYVLRGLDMPTIVVVLVADLLIVLGSTAMAVFLASIPATRGFRLFLGIFGFIFLCYVCAGTVAASTEFLERGVSEDPSSWRFWAAFGGLAAAVLGFIGLLFVWSVAMISPPSSNKALPVRLYTLGYWLVAAVGCGIWSRELGHPGPVIYVWGMFGAILFGIQLLTAVSERDDWGPRVARRIPRHTLLRMIAFPFYSGAAGGLLFGVIGGALTVAGVVAWHELNPSPHWPTREEPVYLPGLVLGYTYCYCLTALLVRRMGHGTALRPGFTWLVALILFGLGSVLPFILRYALFESHSRYGYPSELMWLYLPSPVVMIEDAVDRRGDSHETMTITFLAVWAVVVTLLNAGWLMRQAANFRPSKAAGASA